MVTLQIIIAVTTFIGVVIGIVYYQNVRFYKLAFYYLLISLLTDVTNITLYLNGIINIHSVNLYQTAEFIFVSEIFVLFLRAKIGLGYRLAFYTVVLAAVLSIFHIDDFRVISSLMTVEIILISIFSLIKLKYLQIAVADLKQSLIVLGFVLYIFPTYTLFLASSLFMDELEMISVYVQDAVNLFFLFLRNLLFALGLWMYRK
jgi:hypothetical protein